MVEHPKKIIFLPDIINFQFLRCAVPRIGFAAFFEIHCSDFISKGQ